MSKHEQAPISSEDQQEPDQADQVFMDDFGDLLWPFAKRGFEEQGRGVVAIDLTTYWPEEAKRPLADRVFRYAYLIADNVQDLPDETLIQKARTYDPATQFVALYLKPGGKSTSYRVAANDEGESDVPKEISRD